MDTLVIIAAIAGIVILGVVYMIMNSPSAVDAEAKVKHGDVLTELKISKKKD